MGNRFEDLAAQALLLSDDERAELVSRLLESLSPAPDFDAEWAAEVDRRIDEIEAGRAVLVPGEEVIARLRDAVR
ncbi:MAG: addiction module protein [Burkholderiaceae bacterium]|nr:addiction module protein [Burkholderiaceae bacterium]